MINREHAAKRIAQISSICLVIFKEHEEEAEQEVRDAASCGVVIELRPVTIQSIGDSVYWEWHRKIEFYSQSL